MIHQLHIPGGIQYTFRQAGLGIPMHSHEAELAHDVKVISGSVLITDSAGSHQFRAGEVSALDWVNPHQIIALEPETVIQNRFLFGLPTGYDRLPPEELEWERDIPSWHLQRIHNQ